MFPKLKNSDIFCGFLFSINSGNIRCSMMDADVSARQEHIVEGRRFVLSNIVEGRKEKLCYMALTCDTLLPSTSLPSLLFISLLPLLYSFTSFHFPHTIQPLARALSALYLALQLLTSLRLRLPLSCLSFLIDCFSVVHSRLSSVSSR